MTTTVNPVTKPVDLSWLDSPESIQKEMEGKDLAALRKSLQILSNKWANMITDVIKNDPAIAEVRRKQVHVGRIRNVFNGYTKDGYWRVLCWYAGKKVQEMLVNELKHSFITQPQPEQPEPTAA